MTRRPEYLRGRTPTGSTVHAVRPLDRDPNPLSHGHGQPRAALCGAVVRPAHHVWKVTTPFACKRCIAAASKS